MDLWQVLAGEVPQQRLWAFGRGPQPSAALNQQIRPLAAVLDGPTARRLAPQPHTPREQAPASGHEPLSIRNGVCFSACAAGVRQPLRC